MIIAPATDFVTVSGVETITGAKTFSALTTFSAGATVASGQTLTLTGGTITGGTFASSTITAPALNGTVTTTGLTLPAFAASGLITANAGISLPTGQNVAGTGTAQVTGFATVSATTLTGTLSTAAQTNVTSLGTLTGLTVSGTVSHTNASPFSMTNGQVVTVALTAQTVGTATLTIPDFANVSDTFVFKTKAETLANKTLTTPTIGDFSNANHTHAASGATGGTVDAGNLAGTTLKSTVTASSLTSLGTLTGLTVAGTVSVTSGGLRLKGDPGVPAADTSSINTYGDIVAGSNVGQNNTDCFWRWWRSTTSFAELGFTAASAATVAGQPNAVNDIILKLSGTARLMITSAGALYHGGALTTAAGITMQSGTMALGANSLTMTGTIAATGARVTQSYHTNITSTNAVTVDSSLLSKVPESVYDYEGDALSIIRAMRVVGYQHHEYLDPSNRVKLGVIAETVQEPLVLQEIEAPQGGAYPGINLMALLALQTRAIQQLEARLAALPGGV